MLTKCLIFANCCDKMHNTCPLGGMIFLCLKICINKWRFLTNEGKQDASSRVWKEPKNELFAERRNQGHAKSY